MSPTERSRGDVGRANFGQAIRLAEARPVLPCVTGPHKTGGWRAVLTRWIRVVLNLPV